MIYLACDDDVVAFCEKLGGQRLNAMTWRHHERLSPREREATGGGSWPASSPG